jgi:uncharacterized protein YqgV (UPF0045/DUF77 family)
MENISVEISYYPLNNNYLEPIKAFIERLNKHSNIIVQTNGMSTQVFGEFDTVMSAVTKEIKTAFELDHSIFVMKVINANLQKNPS